MDLSPRCADQLGKHSEGSSGRGVVIPNKKIDKGVGSSLVSPWDLSQERDLGLLGPS